MGDIITLSGGKDKEKKEILLLLKRYFEDDGKKVKIYRLESDDKTNNAIKKWALKVKKENENNLIYIVDSEFAGNLILKAFKIRISSLNTDTEHLKNFNKDDYVLGLENFDININTSFIPGDVVSKVIIECFNKFKQKQEFHKKWASPKIFLPTQDIMTTLAPTSNTKKGNFYLSNPISVFKLQSMFFTLNGHHRCYTAISDGIDAIPYELVAKDDEIIPKIMMSPRKMINQIISIYDYSSLLIEYEEIFKKLANGKIPYKYIDAYPEIYNLKNNILNKEGEDR